MSSGIRENLIVYCEFLCAQFDDLKFCFVEIVDHDVEMELLRPLRVGPTWGLEIAAQLECNA